VTLQNHDAHGAKARDGFTQRVLCQ
jgi:hypothetical protein